MLTLLTLSILSQAPALPAPGAAVPVNPALRTFSDGTRSYKVYESAVLVAEPQPTDAVAAQVRAVDAGAVVVLERPTMRIWKVRDAKAVRVAVPTLRPAFHDVPTGGGRYRVPLGLVCGGVRAPAEWSEVFARSGAQCLPDFWYPPTLR